MAVIGAKKQTFAFETGEKISLRTMSKDEHRKYELEKDKCRFASGKFNHQRYDALQKTAVTKLLVGWDGFERFNPETETAEPWPYALDQVEAFMAEPETQKYWEIAFSRMMVASVKQDERSDVPVEEADPVF